MNNIGKIKNKIALIWLFFLFASKTFALPQVVGTLEMSGSLYAVDNSGATVSETSLATVIDFSFFGYDMFRVNHANGEFAGLSGQLGNISDFQFSPLLAPIPQFWTVGDFSFELTSVEQGVTNDTENFLLLHGTGVISAPGYENTVANWSLSANTSGEDLFAWSASYVAEVSEPDVAVLLSVNATMPGNLVVTGTAESVEAGATVKVTNTENNETQIVTADSAGAFTVNIEGENGDVLTFLVTKIDGSTYNGIPYTVGLINITSPEHYSTSVDDTVNVSGTYTGRNNVGVNVNGNTACTYGNQFYLNNLPLTMGGNTIRATYTESSGGVQETAINVIQIAADNYAFTADKNCGIAPLNVKFDIDSGNESIQQLDIDYNSDGIIDLSTTSLALETLQYEYITPGVYPVIAWVMSNGITKELKLNIVVNSAEQQNSVLENIWNGMWLALKDGDKPAAMQYLTSEAGRTYGGVFDVLMPNMPEIHDELSVIEPISQSTEIASCAVIRQEDGIIKTFIVNYKKGNDGVWRLDSM